MENKLFYRLGNINTKQGLWYDIKGNFTGLINNKFDFCANNKLPMPFDPNIVGWLSATKTIDELYVWFPKKDIIKLEKYGFRIMLYAASEYKYHNTHWLINQKTSKLMLVFDKSKCVL